MRLSTAYSLLVEQELRNKGRFDILSTAMQLMEESSDSDSSCNSRVIDLTGDVSLVAEFVDLSKDPEVIDLCSSSSDSSFMPRGLLQGASDTDTSSSGTGGKSGLPHP